MPLLVVAAIVAYVASYGCNSYMGGYWLEPDWHHSVHWHPSTYYWQPQIGHFAFRFKQSDWTGIAYSPLISIDRALFHPSLIMGDPNAMVRLDKLREDQVHPAWRKWFREIKESDAKFE
ncbi:MAG: hypothetical protein JWM11_3639 [Planctomycetaceae bacterium]|nr:hypothetical protein [Planctomycetaceae bacterium]